MPLYYYHGLAGLVVRKAMWLCSWPSIIFQNTAVRASRTIIVNKPYSISTDGINFTPYGEYYRPEDRDPSVKFVEFKVEQAAQARYIRAEVEGTIECPSWHYGVGHASWFFIDELVVE